MKTTLQLEIKTDNTSSDKQWLDRCLIILMFIMAVVTPVGLLYKWATVGSILAS